MAKKTETKKLKEEEDQELAATIAKINKDFGEGSVMKLGDKPIKTNNVISSGSIGLDMAMGIFGYPRGRIIEIYGPEASGKTTVTLHLIAQAQKAGGKCAFIDAEHALDIAYARKLGVNVDELYFTQPTTTEQALEIADRLAATGKFWVIVIDSVAAMVPQKELEGEMTDSSMGIQARLMSKILRKVTGTVSKTNTLMVFINQLREKIGVMFGSPETTTGGNGLKFYASIRLDIRRSSIIKDGDESIGALTKVKVVKNKLSPPFQSTEFNIIWGEGIDTISEIMDASIKLGIASRSGSWFVYEGNKLANGKDNTKQFLLDNEDLYLEIKEKVLSKLKQ